MKCHYIALSALILAAPSLHGSPPKDTSKPMNRQQNAYEQSSSVATQDSKARTFALKSEAAIVIKDRQNPTKFYMTLKRVEPEVLYYAKDSAPGRTTLTAFLRDSALTTKGATQASYNSRIDQSAFSTADNAIVTLTNPKWDEKSKTLTFEISSSGDKQISEGTHMNPVLFIRVN